jgi:hypothetical protein
MIIHKSRGMRNKFVDSNVGHEDIRQSVSVEEEHETCVVKCPHCQSYTELLLDQSCKKCGQTVAINAPVVYGRALLTKTHLQRPS